MFTYSAAIESGRLNMLSPISDQPMIFPLGGGKDGLKPYAPINYDKRYHGTLPLKMAMGNSLNIPAIKVELTTGIPAVLDTARRMGVTSLNQDDSHYGISLTLGGYGVSPLDMVTGASTLATMGVRHPLACAHLHRHRGGAPTLPPVHDAGARARAGPGESGPRRRQPDRSELLPAGNPVAARNPGRPLAGVPFPFVQPLHRHRRAAHREWPSVRAWLHAAQPGPGGLKDKSPATTAWQPPGCEGVAPLQT